MTTAPRPLRRKSAIRNTVAGLLCFVLLYGIFGFYALPRIIQFEAPKIAAEKLHRNLSIEKVEINPFTLFATLRGVKLMEAQGNSVFAGFDSLTIKVSAQSLLHWAPVVQEVLLSNPSVRIVRLDADHFNFDDITAALAQQPPQHDHATARFSVYNIQLDGGRIEFEDKPRGQTHVISQLKVDVPFVSSLSSQAEVFVLPLLDAKVDGAPLHLAAKARPFAEPRDVTLELKLADVDLTRYLRYLPFEPRFKMSGARLDLALNADFRQAKEHAPALLIGGNASLKSLQIAELNGKQVISLPSLDIVLGKSDVLGERINIARVASDGFSADLVRERSGRLNLQRLFDSGEQPGESASAAKAAAQSTGADHDAALKWQVTLSEFALSNASLHYADDAAAGAVHANLDKFDLKAHQAVLNLSKHDLTVAEIASNSADILLKIGHATSAKAKLPAQGGASGGKGRTAAAPVGGAKDASVFAVKVEKFSIDNWRAHLEDDSQAKPVVALIGPLSLSVTNWSSAPGTMAQIDLKSAINRGGQLALNGKLGFNPMQVDIALDVKSVDLIGLQPYVTDKVNLLFNSANLSTKGRVKLDYAADAMRGSFKGDVTLGNVATVDKISGDDFLRWRALALGGIDLRLAPLNVAIDRVTLVDFFGRVILDPSGHFNLQDIVRTDQNTGKSLTAPAKSGAVQTSNAAATPSAAKPPPPVKIGKLILQNGRVRYTDNFIQPHYTANLMNLHGSVSGLSSDPNSRASVDLHGQVNDAPLLIAGSINPLKGELSLDLKANVNGMELAQLSPYSGRYLGYGIEKGKLSFEVAYRIEQRKLTAQNRLVLDQLTFGAKVDSPKATTLPVQLAVALMRDSNGVIDVNLPIGGSLDDPDFSVGGIIAKIIFNAIEKAVTAPFALLGSLFGGGEELSTAGFDPGSYTVVPATERKLKSLAAAMTERPGLKLEITGITDQDSDRPGLQRAALDRTLRALKLKDQTAKGIAVVGDRVNVSAQEYPALLTRAYKTAKFAKPTNALGLTKDLPVPEIEKSMLEHTVISDDDLMMLGNQRAQAVEEWLLTNGNISPGRLFILSAKSGVAPPKDSKGGLNRVDFSLR
jgi:hypothetical protein